MAVKYIKGDLFSTKTGILAHACNCHGIWGSGIAVEFRKRFPSAYETYRAHCHNHTPQSLLGTCQLISDGDKQIACLYTCEASTHEEVSKYSVSAIRDLVHQVGPHTEVCMPKINAGIFGAPWEYTETALDEGDPEGMLDITVYTL